MKRSGPRGDRALRLHGGTLLAGMVWALWLLPLFRGGVSGLEFLLFSVMVIGLGFGYSWIRR